jgi:DNA-binding NarL/FixJ family response regulator
MMSGPRVVLADDVALLRAGLARLLADAGFDVVGEAADADELVALVDHTDPDVVVVDVRMPPTHTVEGLDAARRIRETHPHLGILILSHHLETRNAVELIQGSTGGVGYLLKDRVGDPRSFVSAVRDVAAGGTVIDPQVVAALLGRRRRVDPLESLSHREREVLAAMAEGRSNLAIAGHLALSPKTVEKHISSVFTKLGLADEPVRHRRVAAVLSYLRAVDGDRSHP